MKKLLYVLFAWLVAIQCVFAAININSASEAELEKLPGIGPVKAKAIVEERSKNGPFTSVEDVKRVKGIGNATLEKLKSEITVTGASASPKAGTKTAVAPVPKGAAKPAVDDKKVGKK
ncbi:MAG: ComEA family DNA-binding protein [Sterolibacterium sp.]|nr:ComEA family DNA-binding protein [Sterolibacterium sp.]